MKQQRSRVEQERLALASLADVLTSARETSDPQAQIWLGWAEKSSALTLGPLAAKNRWQDLSQALGIALARSESAPQPTPTMSAFLQWARRRARPAFVEDEFRVQAVHACLERSGPSAFKAAFEFFLAAPCPEDEREPKPPSLEELWGALLDIKGMAALGMTPAAAAATVKQVPSSAGFLLRCAMGDARRQAQEGTGAPDTSLIQALSEASPPFVVQRAFCSLTKTGRFGAKPPAGAEPSPGFSAIARVLLERGASWTDPVSNSSKMSILKDPSPARQCLASRSENPATPWALAAMGPEAFWALAKEEFDSRLTRSMEINPSSMPSEASRMAAGLRDCSGMPADFALRLLQVASLGAAQGRQDALREAFEALGHRLDGARNPWLLPGFATPSASPIQAIRQFQSQGWPTMNRPLPSKEPFRWWQESRSSSLFWSRDEDETALCGEAFLRLMGQHGFDFAWGSASDGDFDDIHVREHRAVLDAWKMRAAAAPLADGQSMAKLIRL